MALLCKCANTLDTQSNIDLVERNITVTLGTLLSYWRVAKAADKYDVSKETLRTIGFSRAKMIFTAPADHIAQLLEVGASMSASDLEERVKVTRGIRNHASITFSGLMPGDLRETEALLAHARATTPDLSNAGFYRLLLMSYRRTVGVFNGNEQAAA